MLAGQSLEAARHTLFEAVLWYMRPLLYCERDDGSLKLNSKQWRVNTNSHQMLIQHRLSRTTLRVVGSDPKKAHGLKPHLVVGDEPSQWESGGDMMFAALATSFGKQKNARFFLIGTKSRNPLHFFNRLLHTPPPGTKSIVHAASRKDVDDGGAYKISTIKKANPSYRYLEALRDDLETNRKAAKKLGGMHRAQYYALNLNLGVSESDAVEDVIEDTAWEAVVAKEQPERQGPVAIGVDLGGGNSLTALAAYFPQCGRLECHAALPAYPSLEERGQADGIGTAYEEMVEQGCLHIYGVKETKNADFLRDRFSYLSGYVWLGVACDRYKITAVQQALIESGQDESLIVDRAVGRGADGWGDLEAFRGAVFEEHLKPGVNLALEHAIMSAQVKRDNNGNASLDKTHQRGRIDVLQAVIHAVGLGERQRRPTEKPIEFNIDDFML